MASSGAMRAHSRPSFVDCRQTTTAQFKSRAARRPLARAGAQRRTVKLPHNPRHLGYSQESQVIAADCEPSPYFEPLVRTFILGAVAGGIFESVSTLCEMASVPATVDVWSVMEAYPPNFVGDHVLAVGLWLVAYIAECAGITAPWVNTNKGHTSGGLLLLWLASFPKLLLPLNLTVFKTMWLQSPYFQDVAQRDGNTMVKEEGAKTVSCPTTELVQDVVSAPGIAAEAARRAAGAQAYLRDMYYLVTEVPLGGLKFGTLYSAEVMGKSITYWQESFGSINAISTVCSHRGAPLSSGRIETVEGESCVRCAYHNWAFAGSGAVKHVPSENNGRFPRRALQESFDLSQHGGYLWLFWGNPKMPQAVRPPVPACVDGQEAFQQASRKASAVLQAAMPHDLVIEHFMTASGITAAASALLGLQAGRLIVASDVKRKPYSVQQKFALKPARAVPSFLCPYGFREGNVPVSVNAALPSTVTLTFQLGTCHVALAVHVVPRGPGACTVVFKLDRDFLRFPAADFLIQGSLNNFAANCLDRQGLAEGQSMPTAGVQGLHDEFNDMRYEFVSLGYSVPASALQGFGRMDL